MIKLTQVDFKYSGEDKGIVSWQYSELDMDLSPIKIVNEYQLDIHEAYLGDIIGLLDRLDKKNIQVDVFNLLRNLFVKEQQ